MPTIKSLSEKELAGAAEHLGRHFDTRSRTEADQLRAWRRLYEQTADSRDWLMVHRWTYGETVARRTTDDLREKLQLAAGQRVLDVGCASGATLSSILPENALAVGVDHCEAVLHRNRDFGANPLLCFAAAEAARLPVGSNVFDRVVCYSVLQCFPSVSYTMRSVSEMLRVCKPGGFVFIGDVFGELERLYRWLQAFRVTGPAADFVLMPCFPVRRVLRRLVARGHLPRRTFSRRFFRQIGPRMGGRPEFLEQRITARGLSRVRYDVRIWKDA